MSPKLSKAEKRHLANVARQAGHLREIGVDASVASVDGVPSVVLASEPGKVVANDRALRVALAKMKAKPHGQWGPTIERRAKAAGRVFEIEVRAGAAPAHAVQWPPDQIRDRLTTDEHDAATALYEAYFTLHRSSGVTNYLGTGGGSRGGQRLELSERQEMAGRLVEEMRDRVLQTIGPDCWDCARTFILELPMRPGDPRPLTWAEFGRLHGNPRDDHAAVCIAKTAFKHTCAVLASVLRDRGQVRKRRA